MAEDASLDDFLDAGDQEAEPDESGESAADPEGGGPTAPPDYDREDATDSAGAVESASLDEAGADPATTTLDWTPGGASCEACGDVVERRWRDDGSLVCGSCKDW